MRLAAPILFIAAVTLGACGSSGGPEGPSAVTAPLIAEVAAPLPAGRNPVDVAVDGDAVWVLDQAAGRLRRHDAATGRGTGRGVPVDRSPLAVAVGEGAVWVLDASTGVQRVDAATGHPVGRPVPVADPAGIAVGGGAVWVSSRTSRTVVPIDAATMRPGDAIKLGAAPGDIVFAGDSVWVAGTDAGSVTRIDARSRTGSRPLRLAAGQVLALTAGDGAVHAAVSKTRLNDELELVRIDAKTGKLTAPRTPITGGVPLRLATGGGSVWITDVGSSLPGSATRAPRLLRVDSRRRSAEPVARFGGRPSSVATSADAVWVTDSTRGTLTRVELR